MAQVVESLSHKRQGRVDPGVNIMAADGLSTEGARASAAMVLTSLTPNIMISPPEELTCPCNAVYYNIYALFLYVWFHWGDDNHMLWTPVLKQFLVATCYRHQGTIFIYKQHLTSIGNTILKIRQSHDCFIFIMEIPITGKTVFILKQGSG